MRAALRKSDLLGWILLGGAMAVAVAFLFWLQRDLAFADDSFNWLVLSGLGESKSLVEPYGGHLIFTPLLVFKAVLEAFGADYTAFGVIQVALLLATSGLLYVYAKRRVGALLALSPAVIVLFLGSSWNVLLQPMIGIQFLCAFVPGLAALVVLEREDRRGDIAACLLLVLASWGFEMGFAFVVGAAVSIALRGNDRWRRAWIVAVPVLIYGVWKLWASGKGDSGLDLSNLLWIPAYAIDSLGVVAASLFGLFQLVAPGQLTYLKLNGFDLSHFGEGFVLLILGALATFLAVRRLRRRGPIPASFWVAVAVLVTLWVEQGLALAPTRMPGEIRYVFPDTVAFLLVAVEVARGVRVTRLALIVTAALTLAALVGNLARFQEGRTVLTEYSPPANAAIAVMVLGGDHISPEFNPAVEAPEAFLPDRPVFIGAGSIQALAAKYGSPGFTPSELLDQPAWIRRSGDIVAAHALGLHTAPAPAGAPACPPRPGAGEEAVVPRGGAVLVTRRPAPLLAGRFAGVPVIAVGSVDPGQPVALRIPGDSEKLPWRLQAPGSGGLTACPL